MARRPWTGLTAATGEPSGGPSRFSRELSRLSIALILLALAAVTSALTGTADRDAVPARRAAGAFFPSLRSLFGAPAPAPGTHVAELERQERAFRLIAGVEAEAEARGGVSLGLLVRRTRLEPFSWREAEDSLLETSERIESTPSILPANGYIGSPFSLARAHPILALSRPHRGVDVVAPWGSPIVATARGEVSFVGYSGEYGLTVEIDHGRGLVTRYAHASRALVRPRQQVERGDTIARIGRSGLAVGSHVHYEVLLNGVPKNPRRYINHSINPD